MKLDYFLYPNEVAQFKEVLDDPDWRGDFLVIMLSLNSLCIYQKIEIDGMHPFANDYLVIGGKEDKNWSLLPAFAMPFNFLSSLRSLQEDNIVRFSMAEDMDFTLQKHNENVCLFSIHDKLRINYTDLYNFVYSESKRIVSDIVDVIPELLRDHTFANRCRQLGLIS